MKSAAHSSKVVPVRFQTRSSSISSMKSRRAFLAWV